MLQLASSHAGGANPEAFRHRNHPLLFAARARGEKQGMVSVPEGLRIGASGVAARQLKHEAWCVVSVAAFPLYKVRKVVQPSTLKRERQRECEK